MITTIYKLKIILVANLLILSNYMLKAQTTLYGMVSDSSGQSLEGVFVKTGCLSDSTSSNEMGEFQLTVPDSCKTLVFSLGELIYTEEIYDRKIINVIFPTGENPKTNLSLNPRKDYPYGIQLTLARPSLFAISFNYFHTEKQSFEIGICGRGMEIGTRRYFSLNDYGKNKALYIGAITNFSLAGDFVLYVPFGYHILSHNGMAFSIEIGGKTPSSIDENTSIIDFLGFGINFGFQF